MRRKDTSSWKGVPKGSSLFTTAWWKSHFISQPLLLLSRTLIIFIREQPLLTYPEKTDGFECFSGEPNNVHQMETMLPYIVSQAFLPTNPSLPACLKSYQERGHKRAKERTGMSERLNLCFRVHLFREKSPRVCQRKNSERDDLSGKSGVLNQYFNQEMISRLLLL